MAMAVGMHLYRKEKISMAGVSALGGFSHLMSMLVLKSTAVFGLYPVAAIITLFTSVVIGIIAELLTKRLSKIL